MAEHIHETVARLVALHPKAPARTLARRLVEETNGALTLEQARSRIRQALGVNGNRHRVRRGDKAHFRAPRAAGEVLECEPSRAEEWTPHDFGVVGRVGVISDLHIPYHSHIAVTAAIRFLEERRVDGILINGDFADFYTISHWEKRPKNRDFPGELKSVRHALAWIRSRFPNAKIDLKAGNHEERWRKWLFQHAAEISDEPEMGLAAWLKLDRHGIGLVEDQRIVMLGELPVLHGHELPRGISSPVNPARGAFMRTKHTVIVGHQHQTSGHCEPNMFHNETFCWSTGCLCDLAPEYARINRWNWGFAVVDVQADGQFDVENMRITADGKVRSS